MSDVDIWGYDQEWSPEDEELWDDVPDDSDESVRCNNPHCPLCRTKEHFD